MAGANGNGEHKVASLRELPSAIDPPHDLWPAIEARIAGQRAVDGGTDSVRQASSPSSKLRWMAAAAAVIASLAVGVWIGRNVPSAMRGVPADGVTANLPAGTVEALHAAYVTDPRYMREREALVGSLEAQLASLPPETRAKVIASLATIHKSMRDLEAALGRDPSNALLQELLVNTYQDEMRVLTAVHEASETGKGV